VDKDERKGIEVGTEAGDKGYDDGDNHYYLKAKGINSAISLSNYRTEKKDLNKDWNGSEAKLAPLSTFTCCLAQASSVDPQPTSVIQEGLSSHWQVLRRKN
jgi:hypothetical protein